MFIAKRFKCIRKKSTSAGDNTIQVGGLGSFLEKLRTFSAKAGEKMAINVIGAPARLFETGAKVGSAAVSEKTKAALSIIPNIINPFLTAKGLILGKLV